MIALAVCLISPAHAQSRVRDVAGQGKGLGVALVTNGYYFEKDTAGEVSIAATATITNRGKDPVSFTVPSVVTVDDCIVFKVYNEQDEEVWNTMSSSSSLVSTLIFPKGEKWKKTVNIQARLETGSYTLEASIAGSAVGASTTFQITGTPTQEVSPGNGSELVEVKAIAWQSVTGTSAVDNTQRTMFFSGPEVVFHFTRVSEGQPFSTSVTADWAMAETQVPPGEYEVQANRLRFFQLPWFGPQPEQYAFGSARLTISQGTSRPVITLGPNAPALVRSVGQIVVTPFGNDGTQILVDLAGTVPSGGYTNPTLATQELTADGWLVADFKANPPERGGAPGTKSISKQIVLPRLEGMVGVRIRSETNVVNVSIAD